jgi:hypothetical protein
VAYASLADMSKVDSRAANHDAATTVEGAEGLVSLRQQAATSVDDTEEDLENVHAQRARHRGRHRNYSLSRSLICS